MAKNTKPADSGDDLLGGSGGDDLLGAPAAKRATKKAEAAAPAAKKAAAKPAKAEAAAPAPAAKKAAAKPAKAEAAAPSTAAPRGTGKFYMSVEDKEALAKKIGTSKKAATTTELAEKFEAATWQVRRAINEVLVPAGKGTVEKVGNALTYTPA